MATYVLVHGGGHGGWCYKFVAAALRAAGHEVHAPTLSGLAERAHLLSAAIGLECHVAEVAGLIEYEDLRDVVLVGHSYGGMVVSGAADRVPGRIRRLVFLDAAIPQDGEALIEVSPGLLGLRASNRVVDGVELALWPDGPAWAIYGLDGCVHEAWARERLTPHPWRTLVDRLHFRDADALAAIPRAIINCTHTLSLRPPATRHRWLAGERVLEIDTGHDLMLTAPAETAAMLADLA